jgi:hypothetical protein
VTSSAQCQSARQDAARSQCTYEVPKYLWLLGLSAQQFCFCARGQQGSCAPCRAAFSALDGWIGTLAVTQWWLMRIHVIGKPKIFGSFLSGVPAGSRGVNEGSLGRYGNPLIRDIQDSQGSLVSCSAHQDHQPVGRRTTRAMIGKAQRNCRVSGLDHRLSPSSHVGPMLLFGSITSHGARITHKRTKRKYKYIYIG